MNILIVDDGENARDLLQRMLKKEGHSVVAACNGVEALEVLRRESVAVILADIMMPQMDGYRLCQAVRRDERLKEIPFIIYTANCGSPADEKMAIDLGADAFLRKPATTATILETLQRVMSRPRVEPPRPSVERTEAQVMQEYSDRLVAKLEQRNDELAQLNKTLSESEARYRLLADAAEDFVALNDTEGRQLYVSPSYYRVTGWTPEEIQRTDWRTRLHADDLPLIERTRAANLAGEITTVEHRVRCRDGRWIWIESRCKPILGRDGKVQQLLVWGREVTARKQAEVNLRQSEERFAKAFEASPAAVNIVTVREGRLLMVNDRYCQFFGYTRAELIGRTVLELGIHADPAQRAPLIERLLSQGSVRDYEIQARRKDGTVRDGLLTVELFNYPGEAEPALISMFTDITERKQAEADLQTSKQMLQLILDNIPQGVFWKDRQSRYLGCNAVVARTFGVEIVTPLSERSDLNFGSITPEQAAFFLQKDREVMESNRPQLGIIEQSTFADGRTRWLETNKMPMHSPTGEVIGVLGTWQDITERKEAAEVLQRRAAELERFHRLSVGRELQMIDLKREVNALAQQAGRTPPYDLSFLDKTAQPKAQP